MRARIIKKKLGHFTIPAQYSSIVPIGKSQKITVNNLPVTVKADTLQRYNINGKVYIQLGLRLSNGGTKVLSDPGYKAYLKSAGGSIFELVPDSASTSYKLQPQESRVICYWTEIPSTIKTNGMTLQLAQEDEALKIHLPVQSFKLPAAASDIAVAKGKSAKLMMQQQPVTVKVESMQRMKQLVELFPYNLSTILNSNFSKIVSGGAVRINLYDEFQGRRMLLGSQSYPFIYEEDQAKEQIAINVSAISKHAIKGLQPRRYIIFGVVFCYFHSASQLI
ncbi:hypothetical protein J14TS5_46750 [Paenibacillus lautus]|uniref:hypothetical protein n=1 Tax=Paenibacillus lautus TaxID=1401 RepID=UPI001B18AFAA|nr:hypothetical protein [Paenibacillus lautus]GIO99589.1 hypothetical protein J14TS5_46750 [Paenibacillus lautus]